MPASPHAHHSTWATAGLQLGQVAGPGQCPQYPEPQPPEGTPETPSIRPSPGTSLLPGITCPGASCWVWPTRGLGRNLEAEAGRSNEAGVHPSPPQAGPCPPCAATAPRAGASSHHGCPPLGPRASGLGGHSFCGGCLYAHCFPPQPPRLSVPFPAGTPSGTSFSFQDASDKALLLTRERNMRKPQPTRVGCPQEHPQAG